MFDLDKQAQNVGDAIISQGPWAALAWFLFLLIIAGVVWYIRTQKKSSQESLSSIVKAKDEQIAVVTQNAQLLLDMAKKLSEANTPALIGIEQTTQKLLSLMKSSSACPFTGIESRKSVIEDISEDIRRSLPNTSRA